MRPKIWPKEGQNFSKSKKFKILNEDKKNYNTITTFCLLVFEGHLSPKKKPNKRSIFLFVLAKSDDFAMIFFYAHLKF